MSGDTGEGQESTWPNFFGLERRGWLGGWGLLLPLSGQSGVSFITEREVSQGRGPVKTRTGATDDDRPIVSGKLR